jgi:prolyl oligopeptidase
MMIKYPASRCGDVVDVLHGVEVPDPYRWLEDLDSEETRAWIEAQNKLTFDYLDQIPARNRIRERITALWDYEKVGIPQKRGGRYFFTHNHGLQNQSVLYWMEALDEEPQQLLDPNVLSEDGTVALTGYAASEDGKLLAYGLSSAGSDWQEWHVREVDTGRDLRDHLQWAKFSGASWTQDGTGFYYSRYDEPEEGAEYKGANYYHKLYYHRIGEPQSEDALVYERPDRKEWGFDGYVTEDGDYLVITVWEGTNRENGIFYRDLRDGADGQVVELLGRFDASYVFVGNAGPILYFLTDLDAPMSRAVAVDISQPDRANWQEVISESTDALRDVSLVGGMFVASYLHDAHSMVRVYDKAGNLVRAVELPGIGSVTGLSGRDDDPEMFYSFASFAVPEEIYRYDVVTGKSEVFRRPDVGFDPADYVTEQVFYPSKDGTRIPMFLTYRRGLELGADAPVLLYGYGGFDISLTPSFRVPTVVWMEMGGVFAQANLRGGGEYGKAWHDAGKKGTKQNVFDDFCAAAEWLVEKGYTSTSKLAIFGGSNGGLLVGACLTQRPEIFGACVAAVGVLDMLRFHQFTIGWAWVSDYGSPDEADEFEVLRAYSPYHNLSAGTHYPPTLLTTGDHDDRVYPAHSFKFAAALQTAQAGEAPALIRIETRAGHGAGKPTSKLIEEAADRWAFLVRALRMDV